MIWKLKNLAFEAQDDDAVTLSVSVVPSESSRIASKPWYNEDRFPEQWCEISGLRKESGTTMGIRALHEFYAHYLPLALGIAGTALVAQVDKGHGKMLMRWGEDIGLKCTAIMGSLVEGDMPLSDFGTDWESDDEQVILLEVI